MTRICTHGHTLAERFPVPARSALVPGAIVLARYPFRENERGWTVRPFLVTDRHGDLIELQPFTTSDNAARRDPGVVAFAPRPGLPRSSYLRSDRALVERVDVLEVLAASPTKSDLLSTAM